MLGTAGFEPKKGDRIVRHQHAAYPLEELRARGLIEVYQAYQAKRIFGDAEQLVVLTGLEGTRALFYGVYQVLERRPVSSQPPLTDSVWESEWREQCANFYELERADGYEHLADRVVVDWGPGALAWCQHLRNKPVLEVLPPGRKLEPFTDYLDFSLSYRELVQLFAQEDAHREWRSRLSAVAGVYLILDESTGNLYVGSATGAEGIWGRWRQYARTGHGGNHLLKDLAEASPECPEAFRFSLLQIVPRTASRDTVVQIEARFKTKLGSRAHGLNLN